LLYSFGFEPSVAQPPLPLQEFCPLHPLSPDLQPPFPLQEFWPLQACFSVFGSSKLDEEDSPMAREMLLAPELVLAVEAERVVVVPASRPDMAAVINRDFIVALVIAIFLSEGYVALFVMRCDRLWLAEGNCFVTHMGPVRGMKVTGELEIPFHYFFSELCNMWAIIASPCWPGTI
jgi:hypothetical protein